MPTYNSLLIVHYTRTQHSGNNQSVRSSAPVVSRCFPGGYNVKLYISRGTLAWWLLAFLHSVVHYTRAVTFQTIGLNRCGVIQRPVSVCKFLLEKFGSVHKIGIAVELHLHTLTLKVPVMTTDVLGHFETG